MNEFIKKVLGSLFSTSKGSSVIGVDVGSSAIKVVQLRKEKGIAVLETYGELALGPYADLEIGRATKLGNNKLSEALTDLLREASVTSVNAGFAIPFASSLLTLIEMPAVDTRQLNKMIPLEARKYIPVPINEVMLDWFIVPDNSRQTPKAGGKNKKDKEGSVVRKKREVLLVAIHNEVLNKYNEIVANTHLDTSFFEIEIFSTIRATLDQGLAPVMLIDIGAATTKVYIVEYGIVRISHVINRGSQDVTLGMSKSLGISVTRAEEIKREQGLKSNSDNKDVVRVALLTLDYIFSEADRVLLNYQRKYNKNVSRVILTGGGAIMKGVIDLAHKHLESEVLLGDPFAKVDSPAFLDDVLKEAGPEFTVALGLALRKLHELE
ncbi:type IV pilus assembly protein PilM [Patescibacteria group bacterium]|nr:type IV pilus assembly protein PilM [Patescibacteria group bacterium]